MKRYFLVPVANLPTPDDAHVGEYHYIDLDSHGAAGAGFVALVLMDGTRAPLPGWLPLPALLDAATTLADVVATPFASPDQKSGVITAAVPVLPLLADVGADGTHSGYSLAKQLAAIHPAFEP